MNPKTHRPHKLKKTSSSPGSSSLVKDQQTKLTPRYYLKIIFRVIFPSLILLICARSIFFIFAPPSTCSNPLSRTTSFVPRAVVITERARNEENIQISTLQSQDKEEKMITASFCRSLIDGKANITAVGRNEENGNQVGVLCCDRSHHRTDVCYMKGDIRTDVAKSSSIFLYNSGQDLPVKEKIRPYTRKWETSVMSTIDEVNLIPVTKLGPTSDNDRMNCDVHHEVPGVVLSTGGYTGNVYHDFNDGLIPLYLTTERFNGEVVLLVSEYHSWWMSRYESVVNKISKYEIVDLGADRRVHCFPEMIVGMKIHGELCIDPHLMLRGKGIQNFQALLYESFDGVSSTTDEAAALTKPRHPVLVRPHRKRPKLTILIRKGCRVLLNLRQLIQNCRNIGFQVEILNPKRTTPLSQIHSVLSTSDVMVAVHGAAVTHLMFVRPGSVLIQIVPLGLNWAADEYYGQPARKLGLEYLEYRVVPSESSLSKEYVPNHPVISDPSSITSKGWEETKRIYLGHQNVTLDVRRFGKLVGRVYSNYVHGSNKKHIS